MAIRRKNSRSIIVDGISFRWTVSARSQAQTGKVLVIIKCEQNPGAGIVVHVPCRDFWLDISDFGKDGFEFKPDHYRPIRPGDVRAMIVSAMQAGWRPEAASGQIEYNYDCNHLTPHAA